MPTCAACGQQNPDGFRFCGSARTVALGDKRSDARASAEEALRIYEAKGDQPARGRARQLLASLE